MHSVDYWIYQTVLTDHRWCWNLFNVNNINNILYLYNWLVGSCEDLRRFSDLSAISRLVYRRYPISEIVAMKEHRTSCSASHELNHYTTAALLILVIHAVSKWKWKCTVGRSSTALSQDRRHLLITFYEYLCHKQGNLCGRNEVEYCLYIDTPFSSNIMSLTVQLRFKCFDEKDFFSKAERLIFHKKK